MHNCGDNCQCPVFHKDVLDIVSAKAWSGRMIKQTTDLFKILSNPTRLKILNAITEEELCVCDIAYLLNITKSAVSHQLRPLKQSKLVTWTQKGKMVYYRLSAPNLKQLIQTASTLKENQHA